MKPNRLEQLSDGIFAIVMTILVFEIRVPEIASNASNVELWQGIKHILPSFISTSPTNDLPSFTIVASLIIIVLMVF